MNDKVRSLVERDCANQERCVRETLALLEETLYVTIAWTGGQYTFTKRAKTRADGRVESTGYMTGYGNINCAIVQAALVHGIPVLDLTGIDSIQDVMSVGGCREENPRFYTQSLDEMLDKKQAAGAILVREIY